MKKQLFITDDKGRYYRSKTADIKASGYKWTSDFTKATSLTEKDVEMLTKHFGAIGIDVKTKELG